MAGMNMQQIRLANTSHMLVNNCSGSRQDVRGYALGEQLRTRQDVDLQVGEGVISVPKGTIAKVEQNNSQELLLDLGESLGKFVLELSTVNTYFERAAKTESAVGRNRRRVMQESNPLACAPGAYVEVTGYDPNIGPNRGPKSPGLGGYQTLVGKKGQLATVFGTINGVKTYKIQLEQGGEFVLGETEFKVISGVGTQESVEGNGRHLQECDITALMGLGFGL